MVARHFRRYTITQNVILFSASYSSQIYIIVMCIVVLLHNSSQNYTLFLSFRDDAGHLVRTERLTTKDITNRVKAKNYWQVIVWHNCKILRKWKRK